MGGNVNVGVLEAILRLKDELTPAMQNAGQQVVAVGDRINGTAKNIANALGSKELQSAFDNISQGISDSVKQASRFQDLAERVGIGTEAVQRLDYAVQLSGGTFEDVARGMKFMSSALTDGKDGTVAALDTLHLSLDELRKMTPDQAFLTIAEAIAKVPDPMRQSALAVDMFGRGADQILPAIREGMAQIAKTAPYMKDETVKALDDAGDKWLETQRKIDNLRAEALGPLLQMFESLPSSVQIGAGGLLAFLPSLSNVAIAVLAFGGPGSVLAGLATFFTVTLPGAITALITGGGAALVTFFTATLPEAFGAILAFLGPVGWIAAAIIALGVVWYKWGDDISAIVQKVYTAVKTWLVDKFTGVIDSLKQKIDAVKGYFAGMYDAVVGHSYVPDMVDQIGHHFGRLDSLMTNPARLASQAVEGVFDNLASNVTGKVTGMLDGIGGMFGSFLQNVVGGFMGSLGSLAVSGIGSLINKARGGEEGVVVNPKRDAFLSQWGNPSDKGDTGAGHNLAALLTSLGAGDGGGSIFSNLQNAETLTALNSATDNIINFLGNHDIKASRNFRTGTFGQFLDFGSGTPAMLHNRERVVTEAEGRAESRNFEAMANAMAGLRSDFRDMQRDHVRALTIAMRKAKVYA